MQSSTGVFMMKPKQKNQKPDSMEQINNDSVSHAPESGEPREMARRAGQQRSARTADNKSRSKKSSPRDRGHTAWNE
jgi:hypothetical protein